MKLFATIILGSLILVANPLRAEIILTTHNVEPYSYLDDNHIPRGSAILMLACIFEKMHQPYRLEFYPWKRAQHLVQLGQADGFFAASRNGERDAYAVFSDIIAQQTWTWYYLKENEQAVMKTGFKKLQNVSSFVGANMQTWLLDNGFKTSTMTPVDTRILMKMMMKKRLNAILANDQVAGKIIKQNALGDRVRSSVQKNKPLGVYFSKNFISRNPNFLATFNSHIPACRGEIKTALR